MQKLVLASPPLPSGITIAVNILLELNIRLTMRDTSNRPPLWREEGNKSFYTNYEEYRKITPAFNREYFEFKEDLEIFWVHLLLTLETDKTILVIRDPRDTCYSWYRRHHSDVSFDKFLTHDSIHSQLQGLFSLRHPETVAIYYYYWKAVRNKENLLVVRFEDLKTNPVPVVESMLKFIGVTRSEKEILDAIENSGFDKITQITKDARAGKMYEWKENFSDDQKRRFSTNLMNHYLRENGYEYEGKIYQNYTEFAFLFFWFFLTPKILRKFVKSIKKRLQIFNKIKFIRKLNRSIEKRLSLIIKPSYKLPLLHHWLEITFSIEKRSSLEKFRLTCMYIWFLSLYNRDEII